ncbi:hypothetical protein ACWEPA_03015 [Streptomyces filamentosus]|uniref:hypothetical protein n=1 Tax=Streptomyces filamentosus TaxID=67294 RepID=UPI0037D05597
MLEHKPHAESGNGLATLSGLEPVAVEGCKTCAALAVSRELAREAGVSAAVAASCREISRHPHPSYAQENRPSIAGMEVAQ